MRSHLFNKSSNGPVKTAEIFFAAGIYCITDGETLQAKSTMMDKIKNGHKN